MLLFRALKDKTVSRLWFGQLASNIGDEIYKVAFVWLAVDLIGTKTGYLSSIQLLVLLIFGILGGKWSDRWNPYKTMISIDLLRAMITLAPVIFYFLHRPTFTVLIISSIFISAMSAFFEPAIQTSLPLLIEDKNTLKGATGLLATTIRLARVLGPAIIGILSSFFATIHFFTLNAFSFLISAISIFSISKKFPIHKPEQSEKKEHILENFISSWKTLKKHPALYDVFIAKTITGGTWNLTYGLGIALLIHEFSDKNVKAFGLVMSAYGVGNVISALTVGNMQRKNPVPMLNLGLLWLGIGFIGIGLSYSLPLIIFFAAFSAVGGPLNDLPCTDMIQSTFHKKELTKIFRLRMTLDNLAALVFFLSSPALFHFFSTRTIILACGIITTLTGVWGLYRFRKT
jgi:MFS family permease